MVSDETDRLRDVRDDLLKRAAWAERGGSTEMGTRLLDVAVGVQTAIMQLEGDIEDGARPGEARRAYLATYALLEARRAEAEVKATLAPEAVRVMEEAASPTLH